MQAVKTDCAVILKVKFMEVSIHQARLEDAMGEGTQP
jgi:hypothetical protein